MKKLMQSTFKNILQGKLFNFFRKRILNYFLAGLMLSMALNILYQFNIYYSFLIVLAILLGLALFEIFISSYVWRNKLANYDFYISFAEANIMIEYVNFPEKEEYNWDFIKNVTETRKHFYLQFKYPPKRMKEQIRLLKHFFCIIPKTNADETRYLADLLKAKRLLK